MIVVRFSPPPSANRMWRTVNGRMIKSLAYREWVASASWEIIRCTKSLGPPCEKDCAVSLKIPRKSKLSDLDNRIKPCLDAIQEANIVSNDRQFIRILAEWAKPGQAFVTAEIHELGS